MSTLTKILVSVILAILMMSCNFDGNFNFGVNGNGKVISKNRPLDGTFNSVKISRGLDVYLTQSDSDKLTVEADENLHEIITTNIKNNVLYISTTENIGRSSSKKVLLHFKDLESIKATSGSDVFATNTIKAIHLELETSSGSDMELHVEAETVSCHATSGSDLELSGKTQTFIADASSGSSIEADNLESINAQVKASSGAEINVNTLKKLTAKTSSGGDIHYVGTPESIEKNDGVSGSIEKH